MERNRLNARGQPIYLSARELADRWQTTLLTLRNWRAAGKGPPFFKPAGARSRTLYRLDDIERWEAQRTITTEVAE